MSLFYIKRGGLGINGRDQVDILNYVYCVGKCQGTLRCSKKLNDHWHSRHLKCIFWPQHTLFDIYHLAPIVSRWHFFTRSFPC
jgi:hypothetical protein